MNKGGGILNLAIYLNYNNNTNEALEFYQSIFNAKVLYKLEYTSEMTEDKEKIGKVLHAELQINEQLNLYFNDSFKEIEKAGFSVVVEVETLKEAEALYEQLSEGGKKMTPLRKIEVANTIVGGVIDKFGLAWDIVTSSN